MNERILSVFERYSEEGIIDSCINEEHITELAKGGSFPYA